MFYASVPYRQRDDYRLESFRAAELTVHLRCVSGGWHARVTANLVPLLRHMAYAIDALKTRSEKTSVSPRWQCVTCITLLPTSEIHSRFNWATTAV